MQTIWTVLLLLKIGALIVRTLIGIVSIYNFADNNY